MIWINGKWVPVETALELLALAREIARTEHLSHREALRKAIELWPELRNDVKNEARYTPAQVVLFAPDGQPHPAVAGLWA